MHLYHGNTGTPGHDEEVRYRTIKCQFLITSTAWRNKQQGACGGVGVVMSQRAKKSLRKVPAYSKRIMIIEFAGNLVTTIIVVCSLTNVALEEEIEQLNNSLRAAIDLIPTHNLLVVLGDFNGHLGIDDGI